MQASPPTERGTPAWLWALGCVGVIGVAVLAAAGGGAYVWVTTHSEVYEQARAAVVSSPDLAERLGGTPTVNDWYPRGQTLLTPGGGTAAYTFTAEGPDGAAEVQVLSLRRSTGWSVQDIQIPNGTGWESLTPPVAAPSSSTQESASILADPKHPVDAAGAAALVKTARSLYDQAQYAAAVEQLDRAIEADPRSTAAWQWRGRARAQLHDDLGAASDLDQAVELDPDNAAAWESLAWVHTHTGQDDRALQDLGRFLQLRPGDPKALNDRANAWFRTGNLQAALLDAQASCATGLAQGCTTLERIEAGR